MRVIIGASKNKLIGSSLIQWWMKTDYSHVYARWHLNTQNRDIIYQASHGMVHFIALENFTKCNKIVKEFELDITDIQFAKFSSKCIDLAGQKYSKIELLQIFFCDIANGKILTKDQRGYICSELVGELLIELGYKFNKPKYLLTPKDIIDSLNNHLS